MAIPPTVVEVLRSHRVRQYELRLFAGDNWQDLDLVFTTPRGTPIDQSHVSQHFKRMLKKAVLPDMRFHDLRHTCASLLLTQNVSMKVVSERFGHSSISITMDLYSHILPAQDREAADALDEVLRGAS